MLRRSSSLTKVATSCISMQQAMRSLHHKPTKHDWSMIWANRPTKADQDAIESQMRRTVSAVVPGEMFMRHWIAAEQSTMSVANRVISGMIIVVCMVWAAGYATLGYNSHTCAHVAGWIFLATYLVVLYSHQLLLGLALGLGATGLLIKQ